MPLGSDKARQAREQSWQRLLQQLEMKQRYVDNTAAEEDKKYQQMLRQQEEDSAGSQAVTGAQLGMAVKGPIGALIGGLAGKAKGSIEYGAKHGVLRGIGKFLDPRGEINTLTGSAGGTKAGGSIAQGFASDEARRQRASIDDMKTLQGDRQQFGAMKPGEGMASGRDASTSVQPAWKDETNFSFDGGDDAAADEEFKRRLLASNYKGR